LTPSALFRAGTEGLDSFCKSKYKKSFELLTSEEKESLLKSLQSGKIDLPNGIPSDV
jgi:gluconate 2-dehydrogenase gamma chain